MTAATVLTPPRDHSVRAMVAIEAVLLWPRREPADRPLEGLWPVLALVLGDRTDSSDRSVRRLFTLLDDRRRCNATVLDGTAVWAVAPGYQPLLRLSIRARSSDGLDLDILVPARPIRSMLARLATGGVVAVTTRRHADRLTTGSRMGEALRGLVLINCKPSAELSEFARTCGATR